MIDHRLAVFLLIVLVHAWLVTDDRRSFSCMKILREVASLGRWRCVCPGCDGTGFCNGKGSTFPHSCCGDCSREWTTWELVPDDFNGKRQDRAHRPIIGSGWVLGSFWTMLRLGWWRTSPVRRQRAAKLATERSEREGRRA